MKLPEVIDQAALSEKKKNHLIFQKLKLCNFSSIRCSKHILVYTGKDSITLPK